MVLGSQKQSKQLAHMQNDKFSRVEILQNCLINDF